MFKINKESKRVYTHYYPETLDPQALRGYATWATKVIEETKSNKRPVLLFQGLSGTTRATAIGLVYQAKHPAGLDMIYIRKKDESRHASDDWELGIANNKCYTAPYRIQTEYKKTRPQIYFVDDLVADGGTIQRCITGFQDLFSFLPKTMFALLSDDNHERMEDWYTHKYTCSNGERTETTVTHRIRG